MSIIHLEIRVDTSRKLVFPQIMLGQCFVFVDAYIEGFSLENPLPFYRISMSRKTGMNAYYKVAYGYRNFPKEFFHDPAFSVYSVVLSTEKHHEIQRELDVFRSLPQPEPGSLVLWSKHKNA